MQVPTTLLPMVVLLRFVRTFLRWGRGGAAVPLLAGGSLQYKLPGGGVFVFTMDIMPFWNGWDGGSASKFSLLVRVLTTLLSGEVLCRFLWTVLRRMRGGPTVPLYFFFIF